MTYSKPVVVAIKEPPIKVMCGHGNKCNGPKDNHITIGQLK